MHQMEFNCNEMDTLFGLPTEDASRSDHGVDEVVSSSKEKKERKKGGRSSVVSKFPQIPAVFHGIHKKQWV